MRGQALSGDLHRVSIDPRVGPAEYPALHNEITCVYADKPGITPKGSPCIEVLSFKPPENPADVEVLRSIGAPCPWAARPSAPRRALDTRAPICLDPPVYSRGGIF